MSHFEVRAHQRPLAASQRLKETLEPARLLAWVETQMRACIELERELEDRLCAVHPGARESARNLIHYLALRREDLRSIQPALAELGLSSLGRSEGHTLANLDAIAACLGGLVGKEPGEADPLGASSVTLQRGRALLDDATHRLLGDAPKGRIVRIMVTLPTEAAIEPALIGRLLDAGMTIARINSAHDSQEQWERMCQHVRAESARRGTHCRILFDLAGPKIRTGPIERGPEVLRIKPERDAMGCVIKPAEFLLVPDDQPTHPSGAVPVPSDWIAHLHEGDLITVTDARRKRREFRVAMRLASGACVAQCDDTTYLVSGALLFASTAREAVVGTLPATEQTILLRAGDQLTMLRNSAIGHLAPTSPEGTTIGPAVIGITLPEALRAVQVGHSVWFDDGKIGGVVTSVDAEAVRIRITDASAKGDALHADRGVNLPDTPMHMAGVTEHDMATLPFAATHADLIGLSFVQRPRDIRALRQSLTSLGGRSVGIVLKIETRRAFENLPDLLLAALEGDAAGVMIARGDLAVEMGYGRLAEVQEELLWMCEAAHIPVIWATQVLETLAKKGRPSRAEVTDAAMAVRAECVMLNKGPYIVEAVAFLDGVLRRMQEHQLKKSPMLRALGIAQRFGRVECDSVESVAPIHAGVTT